MTFTALLDTAIGLVLIYLGAALFVTVANETFSGVMKMRGTMLADNLKVLLGPLVFQNKVLTNPLFKSMRLGPTKIRSYVDPVVLAQVLVSEIPQAGTQGVDLLTAIKGLDLEPGIQRVMATLAESAKNDVGRLTKSLATWLDKSMTILGEGYKRRVHLFSFVLGLVLAFAFNIDTLNVSQRLYRDKDLRDAVASSAQSFVAKTSSDVLDRCMKLDAVALAKTPECAPVVALAAAVVKRSDTLGQLPIGWPTAASFYEYGLPTFDHRFWAWLPRVLGWILTALAVSLGAPFWFDLLNRFVNVKTTVPRPEVQTEPAGKDRDA